MQEVNLHGVLAYVALRATLYAIVVIPILLALYRFSVWRTMRKRAGRGELAPAPPPLPSPTVKLPELRIDAREAPPVSPLCARALEDPRRTALAYALGGIAFGAWLAMLMATDGLTKLEFFPRRYTLLLIVYCWPILPAVAMAAIASRWIRARTILLGAALSHLAMFIVALEHYSGFAYIWVVDALGPSLVLLVFANRHAKVSGVIVALTLAIVFAAEEVAIFGVLRPYFDTLWQISEWVRFGVTLVLSGFAVLAWWLFAVRFERKKFSDQSFYFAAYFLVFDLWWCLLHASMPRAWLGAVAFLLYQIVVRIAQATLFAGRDNDQPLRLLLLRVFGSAGRTQRLIEALGLRWRFLGPVHLIAGTDLATANLDPSELFSFLTLRFRRLYVRGPEDLNRRLANVDEAPDPDARYRFNDFFCFDDTWRLTLNRLLDRSDVVLLDARGYTTRNAGVTYELGRLFARKPLRKLVIFTDADTEHEIRATIGNAWQSLDASSVNIGDPAPTLRVLRAGADVSVDAIHLLALLCDGAIAPGNRTS
jgi:hypothetical protein